MEVTASLRRDKANAHGNCPVRITAYLNGKRAFFPATMPDGSTVTVPVADWDAAKRRVKPRAPWAMDKNAAIQEAIRRITAAGMALGTELSPATLKKSLLPQKPQALTAPVQSDAIPPLADLAAMFLEYKRTDYSATTKTAIASSTLRTYKSCLGVFSAFIAATGQPFDPAGMDRNFYNAFHAHAARLGLGVNYFGTVISRVKNFLGWLSENHPCGVRLSPRWRKWPVPSRYGTPQSLTPRQVRLLRCYRPPIPFQQRCLDLFLFATSTGLHISDVNRAAPQHLKDGIITLARTKTRGVCHIPLMDDDVFCAGELIEKYAGQHPTLMPKITGQVVNRELKTIFAEAGVEGVDAVFKLGRKTFVTVLLHRGVPASMVMRATGHRDYKSFSHYAGVDLGAMKEAFTAVRAPQDAPPE